MDKPVGSDRIGFVLNGSDVVARPLVGARLSSVLRETFGARDVKVGCDAGDCGACTVLLDGAPVCACLTAAHQADGRRVETLAGLVATDPITQGLARNFEAYGAAQCGICTPGMMVSATALLRQGDAGDETAVADALGGVLCRCTGYRKIIAAVQASAASRAREDGPGHVGAAIQRLDGAGKTHGTERFGDDVAPAGTLVLRVIRAPFHRAAFRLDDLDAWADAQPGIVAALTPADIPGNPIYGVIPDFADQPVFAQHETRFKGEAVAALVGTPDAIARLDMTRLPIQWTELPARLSMEAAVEPDAPMLHPNRPGNVMCEGIVTCGAPEAALEAADVVVEGRFVTGFVEHAYIEPEAGFAQMVNGRVELHTCTQAPMMTRIALAGILGVDEAAIRIVPTGVGGGFGSKLDLSVQPFLALAALKTGQPVRMAYSRRESMASTTKRHPAEITARVGAKRDGRLNGMRFRGRFNTGAYASWGPTVANRVPIHASGPYRIADYHAHAQAIHTHCVPSGAFRGFGVPQSAIAQESLLDDLADALGMDRLEIRILNALENGVPTVCGQVFEAGVGIGACLRTLRPAWRDMRAEAARFNSAHDERKRGVGVAAGWYGCGNTSLPNPSTIKAGIRADGQVVLHQGAVDIGQGSNTVVAQIFATALGVPVDLIVLASADTDVTPDAGKTSASRQTFVSGNAAKLAGEALRAQLLRIVNAGEDATLTVSSGAVLITDGSQHHRVDLAQLACDADGYVLRAEETYDPPTTEMDKNGQGAPYAQFGYAAHLAMVEVDLPLGTVRPVRMVAAHDVGRAINPMLVEGQVEGGIAQGLGMALMEEFVPGRTENLHDYLIPTIGDVPPIDTLIIEDPDLHGPYGAKGLGEHALIPTAPAILNAIKDATGVRLRQVPATPARIRAALRERRNG